MAFSRRVLIGLSGVSASGKTTVARLLRDILPVKVVILHQDDFFLPEAQLPVRKTSDGSGELVDWDSHESLDVAGMTNAILSLRETGNVPAGFASKEDRNAIGPSGVDERTVAELRAQTRIWWDEIAEKNDISKNLELFIIDGFLLFGESVKQLGENFDLRLLLPVTYSKAKDRRENRTGYATIEGFWTDPPGYWDEIVWPAFVREHKYLFKGGDVEGEADELILKERGIEIGPGGGEQNVEQLLTWVLSKVKQTLSKVH